MRLRSLRPLLLAGLLTACAHLPTPEPTPESATRVTRVGLDEGAIPLRGGWLRHPRWGVLEVLGEDAQGYDVRVPDAEHPATDLIQRLGQRGTAPPGSTVLQPEGALVERGSGLPRRGQWRNEFLLDEEAQGVRLTAPSARKSLASPRRWRRDASGQWTQLASAWPNISFDYGGVATGDFDDDGRDDLVLPMHLGRVEALFGTAAGWASRSTGLPGHGAGGSSVAAAVRTQPDGDRLLLLRESAPAASPEAPGLAEYQWTGERWNATPIENGFRGTRLRTVSVPHCAPLLAVQSSRDRALPLFEFRHEAWQPLPPLFDEDALWFATAIDLGNWDSQRCADLLAARWVRTRDGWQSVIDFRPASAQASVTSIAAWRGPRQRKVTALAGRRWNEHVLVLAGDDRGALDLYRLHDTTFHWVAHAPASDWRNGCAVSHIAVLPVPAAAPAWMVAFAGDNDLYHPGRCAQGGGMTEIHWVPASAD